jgi:large conductance mechanosensitive channel
MFKAFKEFAMRGNVIDMAVGIIIGSAFGNIIKSLVEDILMPPIGLLIGGVDFSNFFLILKEGTPPKPYGTLSAALEAGAVTLNWGMFINTLISFLLIAFAVFLLIQSINKLRREEKPTPEKPTTKACPFCTNDIPIKATRCPFCTSELHA